MGKSTISMVIFHSYVTNYQRVITNQATRAFSIAHLDEEKSTSHAKIMGKSLRDSKKTISRQFSNHETFENYLPKWNKGDNYSVFSQCWSMLE